MRTECETIFTASYIYIRYNSSTLRPISVFHHKYPEFPFRQPVFIFELMQLSSVNYQVSVISMKWITILISLLNRSIGYHWKNYLSVIYRFQRTTVWVLVKIWLDYCRIIIFYKFSIPEVVITGYIKQEIKVDWH